jgi:hypothetical protein
VERIEDRVHARALPTARRPDQLVTERLDAVIEERTALRLATSKGGGLTRELRAIGFTLADAVGALGAHDAGDATCESERWRLQTVLDRVEARLAELSALRNRIVDAQQACADGRCVFTSRR